MEITQVRVHPIDDTKLKGFASIVFDDCFLVSDIKIIQGNEGFFVSMPSKRKRDGQYKDVAHPINRDMRQEIEMRIFSEYRKVTGMDIEARTIFEGDPALGEDARISTAQEE